jgi:hypothetical protein
LKVPVVAVTALVILGVPNLVVPSENAAVTVVVFARFKSLLVVGAEAAPLHAIAQSS